MGELLPVVCFVTVCAGAAPAGPDTPAVVPRAPLRELRTDRPDATESPYTVPAGRMQVELSFLEYTGDREAGARADELAAFPINVKLGLRRDLDVQLVLAPYRHHSAAGGGASERASGVGDLAVRAKLNLSGNDVGRTAVAVMPFVRFPTGASGVSGGHVEYGVIVPVAVRDLPGAIDVGAMAELDVTRNAGDDPYGVDLIHSVTAGHALLGERSAFYVEYLGSVGIRARRGYAAYFDAGVTYSPAANVQLDAGVNVGLSRPADDVTVFAGLAFRT